jgi:hypothetical protein
MPKIGNATIWNLAIQSTSIVVGLTTGGLASWPLPEFTGNNLARLMSGSK